MTVSAPWLADLAPTPEPFQAVRPDPDTLVVRGRSGLLAAAVWASIPSALVIPFVLAFGPAWLAVLAWGAAAVALTRWLSAGISYTLTRSALSIRRGREVPVVVPWDLVVAVEVRRDPFQMDEPVVHSFGEWVSQGPRSPHVAVQIRRGPVGLDAGTLRLGSGLNDAALEWLRGALYSAWKGATAVE